MLNIRFRNLDCDKAWTLLLVDIFFYASSVYTLCKSYVLLFWKSSNIWHLRMSNTYMCILFYIASRKMTSKVLAIFSGVKHDICNLESTAFLMLHLSLCFYFIPFKRNSHAPHFARWCFFFFSLLLVCFCVYNACPCPC